MINDGGDANSVIYKDNVQVDTNIGDNEANDRKRAGKEDTDDNEANKASAKVYFKSTRAIITETY